MSDEKHGFAMWAKKVTEWCYAAKLANCKECEFYQKVKSEEAALVKPIELLERLKS